MSSQCFTFMKVTIGNLFALSVQLNLIPTKQCGFPSLCHVKLIRVTEFLLVGTGRTARLLRVITVCQSTGTFENLQQIKQT